MNAQPTTTRKTPGRPPVRAVMFDLDGTLADTLADIAAAGNHVRQRYGLPSLPEPRYRYLAGQGLEFLIRESLGASHAGSVAEAMSTFRAFFSQHGLEQTRPYPGVMEMLGELERRGLPMCVLSNKPHENTLKTVRYLFPEVGFRLVYGAKPEFPLKPDPASALHITSEMDIPTESWLYVGDTRVDMETATGMFAVGVTWGFRDENELRQSGADRIIHKPSELLACL